MTSKTHLLELMRKKEKILVQRRALALGALNNEFIKKLRIPWVNPIFKLTNAVDSFRKKTCFLVKKARLYTNFNDSYFIHETNSINLENLNCPLHEKVNMCKNL